MERKNATQTGALHDLPKHPQKVLPKFDPGKGVSTEDHLKNFYLDLNI